jgi:hypothetical protein
LTSFSFLMPIIAILITISMFYVTGSKSARPCQRNLEMSAFFYCSAI